MGNYIIAGFMKSLRLLAGKMDKLGAVRERSSLLPADTLCVVIS